MPHQAPHVPEEIEQNRNHTTAHPSTVFVEPVEPDGGPLDARELATPDERFAFEIPVGVHPLDRSIPGDQLARYSDSPVHHDTAGNRYTTGRKNFGTDNGEAFPVFERASSDWTAGSVVVGTNNGGTSIVVGRVRGRKTVTVWVPSTWTNPGGTSTTPNGVVIGQTEGELQSGAGAQLNPGDSITIGTEAPVWAALIPGKTSGVVQYLVEYNPAGGELTGQ